MVALLNDMTRYGGHFIEFGVYTPNLMNRSSNSKNGLRKFDEQTNGDFVHDFNS